MKCKYCGAELPNGTNFCTNCGKDLRNLRKCVKCGEIIDDDATFCPFCGTEQPVYQEDKPRRKWLVPVIVIVVLAAFCVGGYYLWGSGAFDFAFSSNANRSEASKQSTEYHSYGPNWLHQSSFVSITSTDLKIYLKFENDGSFSLWDKSGGDQTTTFTNDGYYTVSGDKVNIKLNTGSEMNYTLNEGKQSVISSNGTVFTKVDSL